MRSYCAATLCCCHLRCMCNAQLWAISGRGSSQREKKRKKCRNSNWIRKHIWLTNCQRVASLMEALAQTRATRSTAIRMPFQALSVRGGGSDATCKQHQSALSGNQFHKKKKKNRRQENEEMKKWEEKCKSGERARDGDGVRRLCRPASVI